MLEGDDEKTLEIQEKIDAHLEKQSEIRAQEIAKKIIAEKEQAQLQLAEQQEQSTLAKKID